MIIGEHGGVQRHRNLMPCLAIERILVGVGTSTHFGSQPYGFDVIRNGDGCVFEERRVRIEIVLGDFDYALPSLLVPGDECP